MHRKQLLALLQRYKPTPAEVQTKEKMIDFITKYPDCFERSLAIGHVTASAWLESKDGSHALLLHHAKLDRWFQVGGHCDGSPDVLAVAIKEAQEESGILGIEAVNGEIFDLDIHRIPANSKEAAHDHYDVRFLLRLTSDETPQGNHESKAFCWVGKKENNLPTEEESVRRLFHKWRCL